MSFAARYPGKCSECSGSINVGDLINWNRKQRGVVYHVNCPNGSKVEDTIVKESAVEVAPKAIYTDSDGNETDISDSPVAVAVEEPKTNGNGKASVLKGSSGESTGALPDGLMAGFASALMPHIEAKLDLKVNAAELEDYKNAIKAEIDAKIASLGAPLTIKVENSNGHVTTVENAHAMMPKLLYLVGKKHHVYLYGMPGSGKSTAAHQAAKAIGVSYGYISLNPQTPESRLIGYMDATGNYHSTLFVELYKNGGIFCIDEIDNSSPALLTTLNGCLENGVAAFPCGMIERHPDFVCVATGNTSGRGASYLFPDRRSFDGAMTDRFTFLAWDYDAKLEMAIALAYNGDASDWVKWVQKVRAHVDVNKIRLIVSPRVSYKGAQYLADAVLKRADVADALLFKGIDPAIKSSILSAVPLS